MVDIILEIKTNKTIRNMSEEAHAIFGKGGYSAAQFAQWGADGVKMKVENFLGYCNTPVWTDVHGKSFVVARVDDIYAEQIEIMVESNTAKFIKRVITVDGEPFMLEMDDGEGGTRMQEIGKIA